MNFLLYLPFILSGTLFLLIAFYTWRDSGESYRKVFWYLSILFSWLCICYVGELTSDSLEGKMFFNDLEYISFATLPLLFYLFSLAYATGNASLVMQRLKLLWWIPVIFMLMVWTNSTHHLYYANETFIASNGFSDLDLTYGPLFIFFVIYATLSVLLSLNNLLRDFKSLKQSRKRQRLLIVLGMLTLLAGFIVYWSVKVELPSVYFLMICYCICGFIIYLGAFRTELFVIVPLASSTMLNNMRDAAVALNIDGGIVRANPSAQRLANISQEEMISRDIKEVMPFMSEVEWTNASSGKRDGKVCVGAGDHQQNFNIQMQGLANAKGVCVGELIIIRDVTDEMRVEEALKVANTKLSLISNITRHDMLNQMVVVRGYASLIADHPECEENARCVERITRAVFTMEHLITFAKDYQQFGLEAPVWQRLDNIVRMAKATVPPDKVKVTIDVEEIEVFGDLMLERVFYNLFDNSIQHGGNVRSIMVSARKVGNDLSILFEDDGDGIPEEDRERLFEWGFGKNTGLGLAMCRQILTMSEWKIVLGSNGGKGAKFEITVPVKGWRWAG